VTTRPDAPTAVHHANPGRRREARFLTGARELLVRHWAITAVLLAGLLVRVLVVLAYNPFFWFTDTPGYLNGAENLRPNGTRPWGYSGFLLVFQHLGLSLREIVVLQHLLVLGLGVLLHAFLVHRGVARWLAALAIVPLALSPLVVNIEHHVLSDSLFIMLFSGSAVALAWSDGRPGTYVCALGGFLAASAAITRQVALVMALVLVAYLLVRRVGVVRVGAFVVAFAIPVTAYFFWMHETWGVWSFSTWRGKHLYARVAPIAQCDRLGTLTAQERLLCDPRPLDERPGPEGYLWVGEDAPARSLPDKVDLAFARKVILHQPLDYLRMVGTDTTHLFYPGQRQRRGEPCVAYWAYPDPLPGGCRTDAVGTKIWARHPFQTNETLSPLLRNYQRTDYAIGPFFLLCLLITAAALLWRIREPRWRLRLDAALFAVYGFGVMFAAFATANFSYRYSVPLYATLPLAAALATAHFLALRSRAAEPLGEPT
jgi:4-amino-4-deoxy-L-arabinose transferase-like glycosyltransferase